MTYAKKGSSALQSDDGTRGPQAIRGSGLADPGTGFAAWLLVHPGFPAQWTTGTILRSSPGRRTKCWDDFKSVLD